jgi:hypothetical protein
MGVKAKNDKNDVFVLVDLLRAGMLKVSIPQIRTSGTRDLIMHMESLVWNNEDFKSGNRRIAGPVQD